MMEDTNRRLVEDFIEEVWNRRNYRAIAEYISPEYKANHLRRPETSFSGIGGVLNNAQSFHNKHPDLKIKIEDVVSSEDKVVLRLTFFDPKNEDEKTIRELIVYRVIDEKIVEAWSMGSDLD